MVGDEDLPNAVALNSTSFNAAQMIGPAVAGLLIAKVGIGWAFVLNGPLLRGGPDFHVFLPSPRTCVQTPERSALRPAFWKGFVTCGGSPSSGRFCSCCF